MTRVPSPNALPLATVLISLACLACVACSSSDGPLPPTDDSTGSSTERDAGSAKPKDAGRKDAKVAESADDAEDDDDDVEVSDEEMDEDPADEDGEAQDAAPPAKDAASGTKQDASMSGGKDAGTTTPVAMESCDELTYETFGEMFLEAYCYECHSSNIGMPLGGIVLDTRAGITKSMSNLKKMVIPRADGKMPAMPKGGNPALTDAERVKFGAWIDCGAK